MTTRTKEDALHTTENSIRRLVGELNQTRLGLESGEPLVKTYTRVASLLDDAIRAANEAQYLRTGSYE